MQTHKDLEIWKRGMKLVKDIYKLTSTFPKEENYGLSSQMRRAAVSIPSNIAEGAARGHEKEYIRFLYIALGSLAELETQLLISVDLEYCQHSEIESDLEVLRKMLLNFIKYRKGILR